MVGWVEDPDGNIWWVSRRWLPWRPRLAKAPKGLRAKFIDYLTLLDEPLMLPLFALVFFPAAVLAILFVTEWLLVLVLVPIWAIVQTLFGKPWTVVARGAGARYYDQAKGWRGVQAAHQGDPRGDPPARPAADHEPQLRIFRAVGMRTHQRVGG